jgi:hypothetical protein
VPVFSVIADKLPNLTCLGISPLVARISQIHAAVNSVNNLTNRGLVLLEEGDMTFGRFTNLFPEDAQESIRERQ